MRLLIMKQNQYLIFMKCILLSLLTVFIVSQSVFSQTTTIVLQPDGSVGKDAAFDNRLPNVNSGSHMEYIASAWTFNGDPVDTRSVIEFDLSVIPEGAIITSALLSLYSFESSINGTHSTLSGSNASVLKRITEAWEENTVTWNNQPATTAENQLFLPATTSSDQDFIDLNVTVLVQDMMEDPDNGHGFLIKLLNEAHYRRMVFGSSDAEDVELRPKLEICYSVVYDCPELLLNIGEACDDGNPFTEIDMVTAECNCEGTPISTSLSGNVDWNSNCGPGEMSMQFYEPGTGILIGSETVAVDFEGNYILENILAGTYDIYVKISGSLQKGYYDIELTSETNNLDINAFVMGDISDDNSVNVLDLSLMNSSFGTVQGDFWFNPTADLNCDQGVNIIDVSLINGSFGLTGDMP